MYEGELAFMVLLKSQPLIRGAGWLVRVSYQQWLEKAFKILLHMLCAITNLTPRKQEFSTAKQEAFTFHCLHYQHIPSWLLVKKRPQMMMNHYITMSIGKTKPWPSALKTVIIYWHFSQFSIEKPTSGKASSTVNTAPNWLETHSWAFRLTGSGDQSTGTKTRTFSMSNSHIQSHVPSFSKETTKWVTQEAFFTAWVSPEQMRLERSLEMLLCVKGITLNTTITLLRYRLL